MARTLILLRHAKADWPVGVPDHERPLAARGVKDAPQTGAWLVTGGRVPDLVLCSTASRTRQTYRLVAAAFGTQPEVSFLDAIYDASAGELLEFVRAAPDVARTVLLVGHCPGVQRLALALADDTRPDLVSRLHDGYPTNTATVLQTRAAWSELDPGGASVIDLASPRG